MGSSFDGIGDNAVLTRLEAGALACTNESVYVLNDDDYRTYLIYKIWKNTNRCTYYDIIRAFKMFWDKPLHYREDPDVPATMIFFETEALTPEDDVSKLLNAPFIKAAGVAIMVVAKTESPEMVADIADASHSGARLYDHDPAGDSSWRGLYRHRAAGSRSTEHHADETA